MATKLSQLTLQGFRSFDNATTISFPENGLVLFQGPSGAGKSTVLMGIAHALGYSPYPATELKSWFSEKPMEVKLTLKGTVEGDANIVRGSSTVLYTDKGDVRGATAVNAKLPLVLGMDTDLLAALTYRPQKTPGLFLSKTNSEMQEFLTTLLQLRKFEVAIEESQEQVKTLSANFSALADDVARAKEEFLAVKSEEPPSTEDETPFLIQVEEAMSFVATHTNIVAAAELENTTYKAEWEAEVKTAKGTRNIETELRGFRVGNHAVANTTSRMAELNTLIPQAKARLAKLEAAEKERTEIWEAAIGDAKRNIDKYERIVASLPTLLKRKAQLEAEILTLGQSTCPRCTQPWITTALESDLVQCKEDLEEVERGIADARNGGMSIEGWKGTLEDHKQKLAEVDPKIAQFNEILASMQVEYASERAKLNEQAKTAEAQFAAELAQEQLAIEKRINQINRIRQVTYDAKLQVLNIAQRDLAAANVALNAAKMALLTCQHRNQAATQARENHQKKYTQTKQRYDDLSEKNKATKNALEAEQDFLALLKGFLTAIFDEVLAEIAWNANEMLRNVPNVAHVTVGFRSESTTAKGTVKRALVPFVCISGVERNPKTALSGGMATAVDLAVDLAVRKVISARTGHKPGWLVLDECLAGIDAPVKEACLGLLKQASQEDLILVVEHDGEFKEFFSKRITVKIENGKSYITEEDSTALS